MVVVGGGMPEPLSSSEDSSGSWQRRRSVAVNRQVAVNTLAQMQRRFGLAIANTNKSDYRALANKSLDALRQTLQPRLTRDIDQLVKRYLEKFFVPAVNNIRGNLGEESVTEEQLRGVCRAMLDGARALYAPPLPSRSELSDSESSNGSSYGKRKESDTESDFGRRKRRLDANHKHKWDPARLTQDTSFIMGSIANKVLGLGQSRGRLYSKHAGLLRYPADSADKEWIANQNLKTSSGGRTYIMVLEDIEELIRSEDYRNSSSLRLSELSSFRAPPFMLRKIQAYLSRHGETSEDYASSTPTPTPPPVEPSPSLSNQVTIKEEVADESDPYDVDRIKIEPIKEEVVSEDSKNSSFGCRDTAAQFDKYNQSRNVSLVPNFINPMNFSTIVSAGISSNNSYAEGSKGFDGNVKVEMPSAEELINADIDFLSGDYCSYAESEADMKKSFDKISDDSGDIFVTGGNPSLLGIRLESAKTDNSLPKLQTATSGSSQFSQIHSYVTNMNSTITLTAATSSVHTLPQTQTLPSFSQISAPMQAHLITPVSLHNTSHATRTTWQPTATRTVYSLASTAKGLPPGISPGSTIVSIGNKTAGSILTSTGSLINLTPKSFSSGNILHNAIVSRNMANRSMNPNKVDSTRTNVPPTSSKPTILPSIATFSRAPFVSVPSKIDDDMSITTTKAMIDNTCNSSAMLKHVLTLGSSGMNKTFLTPTHKVNAPRPSTSASSTLSASHATLTALLSGIDPSHFDKKGSSKEEK